MSDPLPLVRSARGQLVAECGGPLGGLLAAIAGIGPGMSQTAELTVRPSGDGVRWERSIGRRSRSTSVFSDGRFIVEVAGPARLRFATDQRSADCVHLTLVNLLFALVNIEVDLHRTRRCLHTDVLISVWRGRAGWLRYRAEMLDHSVDADHQEPGGAA